MLRLLSWICTRHHYIRGIDCYWHSSLHCTRKHCQRYYLLRHLLSHGHYSYRMPHLRWRLYTCRQGIACMCRHSNSSPHYTRKRSQRCFLCHLWSLACRMMYTSQYLENPYRFRSHRACNRCLHPKYTPHHTYTRSSHRCDKSHRSPRIQNYTRLRLCPSPDVE